MATPTETIWEIEPHTQTKHEILKRYVEAWFSILLNTPYFNQVLYIDGFAGPGKYVGGEDGSPVLVLKEAIDIAKKHPEKRIYLWFIEGDLQRFQHLEKTLNLISVPDNISIRCQNGAFSDTIDTVLKEVSFKIQKTPIFAFIDPFGFKGVPFSIVQNILSNPSSEVFINIMIDSINRFIEHPDPQTRKHITDLFGTEETSAILEKSGNRVEQLKNLYQAQLKKVSKFNQFFEMRDKKNKIIYYLFFATNNRRGHIKMKDVFWKIDETGLFVFSDANNRNQQHLFDLNEKDKLAPLLKQKFAGRKNVAVSIIREFVEDKTSFLATHMKEILAIMEDEGEITVRPVKTDGKKRIRGFPDEVIIDF